jgi:hypothetical protein
MKISYVELENLRSRVLKHPNEYRQQFWGYGPNSSVVKEQKPLCGTAGCLAYNVLANHGYTLYFPYRNDGDAFQTTSAKKGDEIVDISEKAQEILGLDEWQASELFGGGRSGWSKRAQVAYRDAATTGKTLKQVAKLRAQAAALAIEDFIAKYRAIEAFGMELKFAVDQYGIQ